MMLHQSVPHNNGRILLFFSILTVLSLLDGGLTLWGLRLGAIEEANPMMQRLIAQGPVAFMAVKVSLPVILGFLLWRVRNRTHKLVMRLLALTVLAYATVIIAHAHWIVLNVPCP